MKLKKSVTVPETAVPTPWGVRLSAGRSSNNPPQKSAQKQHTG
jgi:hypothetical protein